MKGPTAAQGDADCPHTRIAAAADALLDLLDFSNMAEFSEACVAHYLNYLSPWMHRRSEEIIDGAF